jgi:hypothetical protein
MNEYEWLLWRFLMAEKIIRQGDLLRLAKPNGHDLQSIQADFNRLCGIWDRGMVVRV